LAKISWINQKRCKLKTRSMIKNGENYLVTTHDWFMAPDGEQYKAIYGNCQIIQTKEALGFNPTRSVNWILEIKGETEEATIGGCQINYAFKCKKPPMKKEGTYKHEGSEIQNNRIYFMK